VPCGEESATRGREGERKTSQTAGECDEKKKTEKKNHAWRTVGKGNIRKKKIYRKTTALKKEGCYKKENNETDGVSPAVR
jgi:hypothetical protein